MYVALDKHPWPLSKDFKWFDFDRNDYGDFIFQVKRYRLRINFRLGTFRHL